METNGGSDVVSCNSSGGPTWITNICSGLTPARCHGNDAIERHEMPHNYPSWVHPLLDELHKDNVRYRVVRTFTLALIVGFVLGSKVNGMVK